jgi:hypothetical protein
MRCVTKINLIEYCQFKRRDALNKKICGSLIAFFLTATLFSFSQAKAPAKAPAKASRITVLNPMGQPPPIARVPMAPRLDSLDGKTIYIVDVGFTDTHQLFTEMEKLLSEKYPKTNFVVRTKIGTYFEDDPKLWAEIKEKGAGMIMGVGH